MLENMNRELMQLLEQVAREKGLPLKVIVEAMITAIELAARKRDKAKFDVEYDEASGTIRLFEIKEVVETVINPRLEIDLAHARKIKPDAVLGDEVYIERDISELGRISAQKAKQIINQKVKEAEKQKVYDQFKDRIGDVILGVVQRIENGVVVSLGEAEAILPRREQIPGEFYKRGDKLRAYITEVKMGSSGKWPQIVLSRTCDDFLIRLFEIEVPEIAEGIVQIVGVAREPGNRAKIGVRSLDRNVDPVGACVGMRGARIQSIVRELRGEKIDIIEWSDDPALLASRAVTPAKVLTASVNKDEKSVDIVVEDDQLALAIGKRGQNAKLAVRLTKCRINITSESERRIVIQESFEKALTHAGLGESASQHVVTQTAFPIQNEQEDQEESEDIDDMYEQDDENDLYDRDDLDQTDKQDDENDLYEQDELDETEEQDDENDLYEQETDPLLMLGLEETTLDLLVESGFSSLEDIALSSVDDLTSIPGIDYRKALRLVEQARQLLEISQSQISEVRTDE
ncbi:transcription elongation factor [Candidatus Vecturithrix granuli]|uniref:Transcription termination/antitermination protein NusA n=1 Tax=Vecturithrix granuli TaxID=1499967 RepID=A0A081C376_VECG1|nr:transcription elongation factor [Candidatus Vecturithrix granuli]